MQNTHTHTGTHSQTHTHARKQSRAPAYSSLVKGRVWLAGTQTLCVYISGGAETRRHGQEKEVTLDQPGRVFLLFPFIPPSSPLTFFGTGYFYPHAGRISLVTALNERGRKRGENPGQISGEETGSYAGEESESPGSGCASLGGGGPRTEVDGARWFLSRRMKKRGG